MTRDLLDEASEALRETGSASELDARRTRARVMVGLHQSRVRTRTQVVFLFPIAATFLAAAAFASGNGRAAALVQRMEHWAEGRASSRTAKPVAAVRLRAGEPPSAPQPPATIALEALAAPTAAAATSLPAAVSGVARSTGLRLRARTAASAEAADAALSLYRAAHTAHFVGHDAGRALVAWDAYLAAAPNGQLAPEAQYNRALSLVRLGRKVEARAALAPFAKGHYGEYRKAEASALLQGLSDVATPD